MVWDGGNEKGKTLSTTKNTSSRPSKIFVSDDWKMALTRSDILLINIFEHTLIKRFHYPEFWKQDKSYEKIDYDYEGILASVIAFTRSGALRDFSIKFVRFSRKIPIIRNIIGFFIFSMKFVLVFFNIVMMEIKSLKS